MAAIQPTIKNVDMTEEMQQEAVECAMTAFETHTVEKDIAAYLKKAFDKKYGATWHCIVGRNFGSFVTHGNARHTIQQYAHHTSYLVCAISALVLSSY